ncbi:MAG: SWIM zinc finger family protein [Bacteroidota bacterium]
MIFNYKYSGSSTVSSSANATGVQFAPDTFRDPTFFIGKLNKHLPFREAISALHDVVVSDLRFKPKDKTEYKAWAAQQESIWLAEAMAGQGEVDRLVNEKREELQQIRNQKGKVMGPFYKAQREYFNYLYKKDRDAWFVLDPVITVHPDELFFECFSQDESTYGKLGCNYNVFKEINEFECGTTNIDYSAALYNEFQKIRDYKETSFEVDPSGFEVQTTNEDSYKEVKIDLPDSWVRGFLQVSSAMTIAARTFELAPMDVHNICFFLKRYKEKEGPRSIKFLLEPGKPVKLVIEPWNYELVCPRSIYQGPEKEEVRIWGRRRLLLLERLIPISKKFTVTLLGSGLPSFYVADLGDMNYTLGLSGWTANDWSRMGQFDLMAPRQSVDSLTQQKIYTALKENWFETADSLASRLGLDKSVVLGALSAFVQAGRAIYDMDKKVYRIRELSRESLPMEDLRFANEREAEANKLVNEGEVHTERSYEGSGYWIKGTVVHKGKTFHPQVFIDSDERIAKAVCDCNFYQQNKLRQGPCEHILAVRIADNKKNEQLIV